MSRYIKTRRIWSWIHQCLGLNVIPAEFRLAFSKDLNRNENSKSMWSLSTCNSGNARVKDIQQTTIREVVMKNLSSNAPSRVQHA